MFNDQAHGMIIAKEAGINFVQDYDTCISRVVDGDLVGGVVYNGYNPGGSIAVHFAGFTKHWICRDMIWICFDYPFNQLNVKKLFAYVPETNQHALQMDMRFGFTRPIRIKDVFEDCDLIVLDMYKDECKWLKILPNKYRPIGGQDGRQE